jgi:A nuclease family of the HNH/ENDO VII superfamily with conserved AHH
MTPFCDVRRVRPQGFHCHHIIPIEVVQKRSLAIIIGKARSVGFNDDDFETNGMLLPSVVRNAVSFRLPLHRGSHPQYNALVAERISGMNWLSPRETKARLFQLQSTLKYGLRLPASNLLGGSRDPLRSHGDFRKIDGEIDRLWAIIESAES